MKEWANLTEEGKQIIGHIFTDGRVPLRSLLSIQAVMDGYEGEIYLCDWLQMQPEQQQKMQDFMIKRRGIPEKEFQTTLEACDMCIPLRAALVNITVSTVPQKYLYIRAYE